MKVILLAGYKKDLSLATQQIQNQSLIDFQIQKLLELKAEVIVSLTQSTSEKILRSCQKIDACEIVYDTNEDPHWITNIKSGLYNIDSMGLALPLETPVPSYAVWSRMLKAQHKVQNRSHFIQAYAPIKGTLKAGFPILITEAGKSLLLEQESHKLFSSQELKITKIPLLTPEVLYRYTPKNIKYLQNLSLSLDTGKDIPYRTQPGDFYGPHFSGKNSPRLQFTRPK